MCHTGASPPYEALTYAFSGVIGVMILIVVIVVAIACLYIKYTINRGLNQQNERQPLINRHAPRDLQVEADHN